MELFLKRHMAEAKGTVLLWFLFPGLFLSLVWRLTLLIPLLCPGCIVENLIFFFFLLPLVLVGLKI